MNYKVAACAWCGSKGKKTFHARITWKDLDSSWYKCGACGSLMILPHPSKAAIKKVYEEEYLSQRHQPHPGVDLSIRFSEKYRPTVFSEYALSLQDVKIDTKKIKSILDFGCADGIFLEFCKGYFKPGTDIRGTDLSENMLNVARKRGYDVFPLKDLSKVNKKFDLIALWDVIEHVENPVLIIQSLKKLLAPGGKIFFQTPRAGILGELYGDQWPHLLPVQHIGIASKEGMEKLAKRTGMVVENYTAYGANAPASLVPQPYKRVFDQLAKKLGFGDVQILTLVKK